MVENESVSDFESSPVVPTGQDGFELFRAPVKRPALAWEKLVRGGRDSQSVGPNLYLANSISNSSHWPVRLLCNRVLESVLI